MIALTSACDSAYFGGTPPPQYSWVEGGFCATIGYLAESCTRRFPSVESTAVKPVSRPGRLKAAATTAALVAAPLALRFVLNSYPSDHIPYLLAVIAVMTATYCYGEVYGLAVTFSYAILIRYLFIEPLHSFHGPANFTHKVMLLFFVVMGVGLSLYGGRLRRASDALATAREQLALRQEVARLGSYEWSVRNGYCVWSPEMEKIYGAETPDHRHALDEWKSFVHPEDKADTEAVVEETARSKRLTSDHTYRIIRPNGEIRWIHARRKHEYDAAGNPVYGIGAVLDVTDLKQGEAAQQILGGLLHVCSACRRVRDKERNEWYSMEGYLRLHSSTKVSHGMCEECARQWYSDDHDSNRRKAMGL